METETALAPPFLLGREYQETGDSPGTAIEIQGQRQGGSKPGTAGPPTPGCPGPHRGPGLCLPGALLATVSPPVHPDLAQAGGACQGLSTPLCFLRPLQALLHVVGGQVHSNTVTEDARLLSSKRRLMGVAELRCTVLQSHGAGSEQFEIEALRVYANKLEPVQGWYLADMPLKQASYPH